MHQGYKYSAIESTMSECAETNTEYKLFQDNKTDIVSYQNQSNVTQLIRNDVHNNNTPITPLPRLFRFQSTETLPKIRIFDAPAANAGLIAIIALNTLVLIVTAVDGHQEMRDSVYKGDGSWYYIHCKSGEGFAYLPSGLLDSNVSNNQMNAVDALTYTDTYKKYVYYIYICSYIYNMH